MMDNYYNNDKDWSSMNMAHVGKIFRVVVRGWCPTTRKSMLYRKMIKIIKMKIHALPFLFSMQISHITH
jgi:hypothetical protein